MKHPNIVMQKDIAGDTLEAELEKREVSTDLDEGSNAVELIGLSNAVVEALISSTIIIPEELKDPYSLGT